MDFMNWKGWWTSLFKQAFVVPIFLFFMYLILKFLNTGFMNEKLLKGSSWGTSILQVAVPLLLIAILLLQAKKIATSMSGVVAEYAMKAASFVGGVAGGAMLGVGALGLSKVAGATLGGLASDRQKDRAAGVPGSGNKWQQFVARRTVGLGDIAKTGSFDIRKTQLGKLAATSSGMNFDSSVLSGVKLGTENLKGGMEGREARRKLDAVKRTEKYGYNKTKYDALEEEEKDNQKDFKKVDEEFKGTSDLVRTYEQERENAQKQGLPFTKQAELDAAIKKKKELLEKRNNLAHEAHRIHDNKDFVLNERKNNMGSKEKRKGTITDPIARQDIEAPADMTLPDGTRVKKGHLIVEKGQRLTNSHLKALIKEAKRHGVNANSGQIKQLEEQFAKQYFAKEKISVTVRDEGASTNNPTPLVFNIKDELSPKQKDDMIAGMKRAGASTEELDRVKNQLGYIGGAGARWQEIGKKLAEDTLKGFAVDVASGFATMGFGTVAGLSSSIAQIVSTYKVYTQEGAKDIVNPTNRDKEQAAKTDSHDNSKNMTPEKHDNHDH